MPTTISFILSEIKNRLQQGSPDLYEREAETILQQLLDISRSELYLNPDKQISDDIILKANKIILKRLAGTPLQYALGEVFFYSSNYVIDENVLIPRPDTETIVDTILKNEVGKKRLFADIGTGSGIICQSILYERPDFKAVAIDISPKALKTATKNICSRGSLICCNKLEAIKPSNQFDFIVSNPPYITTKEMNELENSVLHHEPHNALWGGEDGLDFYRYFSQNLGNYLKKGGNVYFEIGHLQGESVSEILQKNNWISIEVIKDLGNRDRVVKARKNDE